MQSDCVKCTPNCTKGKSPGFNDLCDRITEVLKYGRVIQAGKSGLESCLTSFHDQA